MSFASLLAVLTVAFAMPLAWVVTVRLWRLSRREPTYKVLRERAYSALALALIVTVFAVVFINNEQFVPLFDVDATRIITRGSLLLLTVLPCLYWLYLYRSD